MPSNRSVVCKARKAAACRYLFENLQSVSASKELLESGTRTSAPSVPTIGTRLPSTKSLHCPLASTSSLFIYTSPAVPYGSIGAIYSMVANGFRDMFRLGFRRHGGMEEMGRTGQECRLELGGCWTRGRESMKGHQRPEAQGSRQWKADADADTKAMERAQMTRAIETAISMVMSML